jgi:hypothetical protein
VVGVIGCDGCYGNSVLRGDRMMVAQDRNSDNWRSQATRAIGFYCEQMSFAKPEEVQKKRDWKNN